MTRAVDSLAQVAARHVPAGATGWLAGARQAARERSTFAEAFTLAARRVGKATLDLGADEREALAGAGVTWPIDRWGIDEVVRVTLLVEAAGRLPADAFAALVDECYRAADNRERQAVLKALPLLPEPERFVDLAVDACRTSIEPIFEAIACENPYPAAYFPELNWNQMVLKAVFISLALERIIGLDERVTPELVRMARDYASERRAAGRPVPDDLLRLTQAQEAHP